MNWRNGMGGPAIVAVLSCFGSFGCEAQVGEGYSGEVMLELRGHVIPANDRSETYVPALLTFSEGAPAREGDLGPGAQANVLKGKLEGVFPSDFKLSIAGPPPGTDEYGIGLGYVVLVSPDAPPSSEVPDRSQRWLRDEGAEVFYEEREWCLRSGACLRREYRCVERPCEIITTAGVKTDDDGVTSGLSACSRDVCFSMTADCDDDASCYREFTRCDVSEPGTEQVDEHTTKTCSVTAEEGDPSITALEDNTQFASDLWVLYAESDLAALLNAPGAQPGYNLMRMDSSTSAERFIAYANCRFEASIASEPPEQKLAGLTLFDSSCSAFEIVSDPSREPIDLNLTEGLPH